MITLKEYVTRKTCCVFASCDVCDDDEKTRGRNGPLIYSRSSWDCDASRVALLTGDVDPRKN